MRRRRRRFNVGRVLVLNNPRIHTRGGGGRVSTSAECLFSVTPLPGLHLANVHHPRASSDVHQARELRLHGRHDVLPVPAEPRRHERREPLDDRVLVRHVPNLLLHRLQKRGELRILAHVQQQHLQPGGATLRGPSQRVQGLAAQVEFNSNT